MNGIHGRGWASAWLGTLAVVAVLGAGCPKTEGSVFSWGKTSPKTREFIARVQRRTESVYRLDAAMEANLSNPNSQLQGKYYGSLQLDRRGDKVAYWIQAYNVINAPVLEIIADRELVEIFSPLTNTLYVNFTDFINGSPSQSMPMSLFCRMTIPVDLLGQQIELMLGQGFAANRFYSMKEEGARVCLVERKGLLLTRKIYYSSDGLLLEVLDYDKGAPAGRMIFSNHVGGGDGAYSFLPQQIDLDAGNNHLTMNLSDVRINQEVRAPVIAFRPPTSESIVLLTPAVR